MTVALRGVNDAETAVALLASLRKLRDAAVLAGCVPDAATACDAGFGSVAALRSFYFACIRQILAVCLLVDWFALPHGVTIELQ